MKDDKTQDIDELSEDEQKTVKISQISDFFVRCLLGQIGHEALLLHFINACMVNAGLEKFESVSILNPYNLKENKDDHETIVDVKAETNSGEVVIIEIQVGDDKKFANRALYYWAINYIRLDNKRIKYGLLKSIISINIVNESIDMDFDLPHTTYEIRCRETDRVLTDKFLMHFLELPKLIDKIKNKDLWYWLQYFKAENVLEDKTMSVLKENPVLKDAVDYYGKFILTKELIEQYEKHEMYLHRQNDLIEQGREEGMEQGEAIGLEKGKIEIAKNLISMNMAIDSIVQATGLRIEDIEKIKKDML